MGIYEAIDLESAYKQGRADGVNELLDLIDRLLWEYDKDTYKDLSESFKKSAELVKGGINENSND